jgi:hypothetical protein
MQKQVDVFGEIIEEDWEKEWKEMPECIMEDLTAERQIIVNFKNITDAREFGKLINQTITERTKSIWFPQVEDIKYIDKRWMSDES